MVARGFSVAGGTAVLLALSIALLGAACSPGAEEASFSLLTYNVAGLPEGLSKSHPLRNTPLISPKLDAHDLVLVQEDFTYDEALRASVTLPYRSEPLATPGPGKLLGDGLNRFSRFAFTDHAREAWRECSGTADQGSDCLAAKGFSVATTELAPGVLVDVYNVHLDASGSAADQQARAAQVEQLLAAIAQRSAARALIVAGDTNLKPARGRDGATLERLLAGAGLTDACRALRCGDEERIDRVLLRGDEALQLRAASWALDARFVDDAGEPLSDHEAVAVRVAWRAR